MSDFPAPAATVRTAVNAASIDPELQPFIRELVAPTGSGSNTLAASRERAERIRARWRRGGPAMISIDDSEILTARGAVRVRRFVPSTSDKPRPALVYLHGGGWTMFSLDTHDRIMRELAARADVTVIGVDYALSPEARFPAALNQISDVVRWLAAHGQEYGIDPLRLAIGGDSSGANLAAATALMLREAKLPAVLHGLLLIYGCFTADRAALAGNPYGTPGNVLTADEMSAFWRNYLAQPADTSNPLAAPLLADLAGLPPVFQVIAECDVLATQNRAFELRLRAAGVAVEAREYAGATHSFLEAVSIAQVAQRALGDSAQWLRQCLCGPPAGRAQPPLAA